MSDQTSSPQIFNVQIDGVWHQFPKGTRVIEACEQVGVFVPRYCYHKKLSSPGNCRMCLIEMGFPRLGPDRKPELGQDGKPIINWMPRPQISCAQDVAENMLLDIRAEERRRINWLAATGGAGVSVILLIQICVVIKHFPSARRIFPPLASSTTDDVWNIGRLLFSNYNLPFQIIGVLVLVATIGVVLLSRREPR